VVVGEGADRVRGLLLRCPPLAPGLGALRFRIRAGPL